MIDTNAKPSLPKMPNWTPVKPKFNKECILLTVINSSNKKELYYHAWLITKIDGDDGGWYWGWCELDGDEWGDIELLEADLYKVVNIPTIKNIQQ